MFQVGLEGFRDGLLNLFTGTTNLAIKGQETRRIKFDQKAVVILSLYTDKRDQFKARFLIGLNFRNTEINPGFIAVGVFGVWLPGISVGGVAEGSTH